MTDTVLLTIKDSIATLTFNRPQQMNSLNDEMINDFETAVNKVRVDKAVRAVILNGTGNLFMAGGDIKFFYEKLHKLTDVFYAIMRKISSSILALQQMDKPILACVHGSVAGIGMSIMLAADLVLAAEDTKFTMAYSKIGLTPDGGASYMLPKLVGNKKAMELILLSELFDAQSAQQLGLVNWIVPADQLQQEGTRIAQKLAQGPTKVYARIRKLVRQSWSNNLEAHLEAEAQAFIDSSQDKDFKTGISAFLSKQKPIFEGN